MTCPPNERFQTLLEGRLEPSARADLQEHLDHCASCERALCLLVMDGHGTRNSRAQAGAAEPDLVTLSVGRPLISTASLAPGDQLAHFELLDQLGRGAMGAVYAARDKRLGRRVALKVIRTEDTPGPNTLERFNLEARAMAHLSHPNIVAIFEVGQVEGFPWVAMELVEGKTLRQVMFAGPMAADEVTRIAAAIASALAEAHHQGVVHRDLKPENVIIAPDGLPRVVDFGLAAFLGADDDESGPADDPSPVSPKLTGAAGTPRYMAPEQWFGNPITGRTDVWALGVVMYEMLAGKPPLEAKSISELLELQLAGAPAPSLNHLPGVTRELDTIVRSCLERERDDRPSAGELMGALAKMAEGRKRRGRWQRTAAVLALGVGLGATALAGLRASLVDETTPPPPTTTATVEPAPDPSPTLPLTERSECNLQRAELPAVSMTSVDFPPSLASRADDVRRQVAKPHVFLDVASDAQAPKVAVYLAVTDDDPVVVAGALRSMRRYFIFSGGSTAKKTEVFEGYHQAVIRGLHSRERPVQHAALRAAYNSIAGDNPRRDILGVVARFACDGDAAQREAALSTLRWVRSPRPGVTGAVFVSALNAEEPFVLVSALENAKMTSAATQDPLRAWSRLRELSEHPEPAVRGRALDLVSRVTGGPAQRKEVAAMLRKRLSDPSAHVRAHAMRAAGAIGMLDVVSDLVAQVARDEDTTATVRFEDLSGKMQRIDDRWIPHQSSSLAAAEALARLSWKTSRRLELRYPQGSHSEDLADARKAVNDWYAAVKNELQAP